MNTPSPAPGQPTPKKPILIVKSRMTRRDWFLVLTIVAFVLGFIIVAIVGLDRKSPRNYRNGRVTGKSATGERETEYTWAISGKRGVSGKPVDTGYYLNVFVSEENTTYKVIVEKELWESSKDGDTLRFEIPK